MRASRRWFTLALAAWLLAVFAHAAFLALPGLRIRANESLVWMQTFREMPPTPCRVLVVGSSPALFGVHAQVLQQATGCVTLNLAMIGIGDQVEDFLDAVLPSVRPGDVVMLSDRRWTAPDTQPQPCADHQTLRCLWASARLVPHLADNWRLLGDASLQRDAAGDLLKYPPLPGEPEVLAELRLQHVDYRLASIERQLGKIRAAGAVPVLLAVPVLARPEAVSAVQAAYAAFSAQVQSRVQPALWIGPWVASDPADFTDEGLHLSAQGRAQWSAEVASVLRQALP